MSFALAMLIALAIDALVGWPDALYRRIGHPVTWIGTAITALDRALNRSHQNTATRRLAGFFAAASVLLSVTCIAIAILIALPAGPAATVLAGVLAWPLVATRSLHSHVANVARPLEAGDVALARVEVAKIVGRNPANLDASGISRAAIESLAENASDGVVAPVFWGAVAGLPGIFAYKALNTLDSMIGHRTSRHADFGMVSARLDDLANIIPARLTALLFAAVSRNARSTFKTMRRDAHLHRSPNAGWPEAAMAGALGLRLSGPRVYGGHTSNEPFVNADAPDPTAQDIKRGLALFRRSMIPLCALLILATLLGG